MSRWSDTLHHTAHRPYPPPGRAWALHMSWQQLLFAHWPFAPEVVRERVRAAFGGMPDALEIDVFEGAGYLGIVPFRMARTGLRRLPPLPAARAFPELNVRTYVRLRDRPGVLFFSLDAASRLAVCAARRWFHLPYYHAAMRVERGERVHYRSTRTHRGASPAAFEAVYRATGPARPSRPGTLAHWLTERYCLYSIGPRGVLWRGEIHHGPWPLQPAEAEIRADTMAGCLGLLLPGSAPLLHYAENLDVVAWSPERVG